MARCCRARPRLDELPPAMSAAAVLLPSRSDIASGRPPPRSDPLAARVRPPILPSTVLRRRWRGAAARLSRAPHSARRCAGQAAGGPTHRPPRQSPTHSCALCLTAAGRAAVITARLVLHCPCWLALRPELRTLSISPESFSPPSWPLGPRGWVRWLCGGFSLANLKVPSLLDLPPALLQAVLVTEPSAGSTWGTPPGAAALGPCCRTRRRPGATRP